MQVAPKSLVALMVTMSKSQQYTPQDVAQLQALIHFVSLRVYMSV